MKKRVNDLPITSNAIKIGGAWIIDIDSEAPFEVNEFNNWFNPKSMRIERTERVKHVDGFSLLRMVVLKK